MDVGICFGKGIGVGFHWQMLIHFKKLTWYKAYPELQRTSQKSSGRPDVFFFGHCIWKSFLESSAIIVWGPKNWETQLLCQESVPLSPLALVSFVLHDCGLESVGHFHCRGKIPASGAGGDGQLGNLNHVGDVADTSRGHLEICQLPHFSCLYQFHLYFQGQTHPFGVPKLG